MDNFMVLLFDDNFGEVGSFEGKFVGKRASAVIRAANDVANRLRESVVYYTNIPQEALQEYDRLGRVSLRHKPLRDLRRL